MLEELTHIPVLAVLPYLANLALPEEDAVALEQVKDRSLTTTSVDIAVCQLPHIANFDDFDLLAAEPGVRLRFVRSTAQVGHPDLIILPGSKATVADLHWLEETGLAGLFVALNGRGVPILGICGGYQMLGERILDPEQVETIHKETAGLGLLQASTTFVGEKHTVNVTLERGLSGPFAAPGLAGNAYEIHMGRTVSQDPPLFTIRDAQGQSHRDGSWNAERAVCGTYLHGLFESRDVRHVLLRWLGQRRGLSLNAIAEDSRDVTLNRLADLLEERIGTSRLLRIADGATNG
jgi:adenosylcobyric acid synthase